MHLHYLPGEEKNRGSFGAHAFVIDATCFVFLLAFERNAARGQLKRASRVNKEAAATGIPIGFEIFRDR